MKTINIAPKIEKAGYLVVGIIAAMASLFLSVVSLMHTTVVDDVKEGEGVTSVVYLFEIKNIIYKLKML